MEKVSQRKCDFKVVTNERKLWRTMFGDVLKFNGT